MATLRLFASLREEAGERTVTLDGGTVGEIVTQANEKFGDHFAALVDTCRIWVNGEPAEHDTVVEPNDEVALLPPVSGG
jgi:molybdopterin converting factor small subunit